jgi:ATP/maltotriose-dependent transcriptional regulator MalT
MTASPEQLMSAANAAVAAGEWAAARTAFADLAAQQPSGDAYAGLGDVMWWLGDTDDAVHCHEQAYAAYRRDDDSANTVMTALALYLLYRVSLGKAAVARGWLARAARVVDERSLPRLDGWVKLMRAHDSADAIAAESLAGDARDLACRFGDSDLELCALSQLGASLVQQGRRNDGVVLLDEAMAASLAGESTRPHTVVYTCCNLIGACALTAEPDHAMQWIRAADGFEQRYGNPHLFTTCRTALASILFATGDWDGAERELRTALDIGMSAEPAVCAEASAKLAEIRLAQGRLEEAERLLEGLEEFEASTVPRALLARSRGRPAEARRIARHGVAGFGATPAELVPYRPGITPDVEQGLLWELLAQVTTADEAKSAEQRLAELASRTRCAQLEARALRTAGQARDDVPSLERALALFNRLRLPWEAARTRLALASLLTGDDAVAEGRAALASFERLGAAHDADAAAARLRELGAPATRSGPVGPTGLTRREREVLLLLGEGLSNRELAERLYLSRKTVERHVRNVFAKLDLRNRAEAAAYVVRHRSEISSLK